MGNDVFFLRLTVLVNEFRNASEKDKPEIMRKIGKLKRFCDGIEVFLKMLFNRKVD